MITHKRQNAEQHNNSVLLSLLSSQMWIAHRIVIYCDFSSIRLPQEARAFVNVSHQKLTEQDVSVWIFFLLVANNASTDPYWIKI